MDMELLYRDNESITIDDRPTETRNSRTFKIEIAWDFVSRILIDNLYSIRVLHSRASRYVAL